METINLKWKENMAFSSEIDGHIIHIDSLKEHGGEGKGIRPKPLLLTALAGCSGMDVVSILKKMKIELKDFNIKVEAELTTEYPKYYNKIHLTYEFWGDNLPFAKLDKAIRLSQDQYCGVSAMLRKAADISYEIKIMD